jgi:SAM-dependent methyltransferase
MGNPGFVDVKRFFEERLARHGDSPRSLDCSDQGQQGRFKILAEVGPMSGRSVVDLGCGLGHFYEFVSKMNSGVSYTGYDFSEKFVARARAKYPAAQFEVRDVLRDEIPRRFDFVISCGIHNFETGSNDEDMIRLLHKAWAAANDAVAFSMLSKTADRIEEGRHYYDPIQMMAEALRLTRYAVLRQDYMPHDLTLYLYRNPRG